MVMVINTLFSLCGPRDPPTEEICNNGSNLKCNSCLGGRLFLTVEGSEVHKGHQIPRVLTALGVHASSVASESVDTSAPLWGQWPRCHILHHTWQESGVHTDPWPGRALEVNGDGEPGKTVCHQRSHRVVVNAFLPTLKAVHVGEQGVHGKKSSVLLLNSSVKLKLF